LHENTCKKIFYAKLLKHVDKKKWSEFRFSTLCVDEMWLEHLTANTNIATVLGSIPASVDTVEYEGAAD
jgi:hypothetical protein